MKLFGTKWASPWRTTNQLLHRVREDVVQLAITGVLASLPGMGGGDAALVFQDAVVVQHVPVRDEMPCVRILSDVGSIVVSEPAMSDPHFGEIVTLLSFFQEKAVHQILLVSRCLVPWGQQF